MAIGLSCAMLGLGCRSSARLLPRAASLRSPLVSASSEADQQKTLLLCSGGVESAVLLAQLVDAGRLPVPLFADYAQRGAVEERRAAEFACTHLRLPAPQVLDLRGEGSAFKAVNRLHVPLPHRNLVLLSLALSWASTHRCKEVAIGLNKDDFAKDADFAAAGAVRYTTGTASFIDRFRELAEIVAPDVKIILPQAALTKMEVIREGVRLGVPLHRTYSCMRGRPIHCGTCLQCKARRAAFVEAKVVEPCGFYE